MGIRGTRHGPGMLLLLAASLLATPASAERLKDIADIKGVRSNPLWGYGLVIGLNGTGDDSTASRRALTNLLRRKGLVLAPDDLTSKNIASVIVTGDLPPFARRGSRIDVTVSAIGNATSLQGGKLLMAELVGADGQVYAVAQGSVSTGAFVASGQTASIVKNHPTVGRIPGGATVECEEVAEVVEKGEITLLLRDADFTTANRVAEEINKTFTKVSYAVDAGTIRIKLPATIGKTSLAGFIEKLESIQVETDLPAVVIINERTGTIVVGENVAISRVAITHANLSIKTEDIEKASQPSPFSRTGTTERLTESKVATIEEKGTLNVVNRTVSVADIARALNAMGVSARDLISIFQALKKAGALKADLKIM
ncbi:MAG TPA: flagellar basal body P-ring protein FlgI [Phycisphaerae bacterium]|nr:flagellar basal body P-ring protein FlgI [Phycisphaerae bacterium]